MCSETCCSTNISHPILFTPFSPMPCRCQSISFSILLPVFHFAQMRRYMYILRSSSLLHEKQCTRDTLSHFAFCTQHYILGITPYQHKDLPHIFFFTAEQYSIMQLWLYDLCNYSSMNKHLGCFQCFANANTAAANDLWVCVFILLEVSLGVNSQDYWIKR